MKSASLQFALRETLAIFASRRTWAGLAVVSLILGISGPFQTFEIFALIPRFVYWSIIVTLTFAAGVFFGSWAARALEAKVKRQIFRLLLIGIAAGVPVAIIVWMVNIATFGFEVFNLEDMLTLGLYSIIIAMGVSLLFTLFDGKNIEQRSQHDKQIKPAILSRLPAHLRGKLLSLSVQDHYVEIITNKGKHMQLMRFGDAIKETQGIRGIQIHRSHWVAMAEIKSIAKSNGKTIVKTHSGQELPVSRTYMASLEKALQML